MPADENFRVELLLTGNEVLAGDTIDSNSAFIGHGLAELGLKVARKLTVGDDLESLVDSLTLQTKASDVLIVNGGMGPTEDDLTALALSQVMGVPLEEHAEALSMLEAWCAERNFPLNPANRKQAILPRGVELMPNSMGSAAGLVATVNDCLVLCTPGVPPELKAMFNEYLLSRIKSVLPKDFKPCTVLRWPCFGIGESSLQKMLGDELGERPEALELGFRYHKPLVEVKFSYRLPASAAVQAYLQRAATALAGHRLAETPTMLGPTVVDVLQRQNKQITFAESCTGGGLAACLTEVPGASNVFSQGVVSYANEVKTRLLGVSKDLLASHGAVSEEVALAMAKGALASSQADCVVAVSGIAGPSGGSKDKPVGLVCIAWGSVDDLRVETLYFPGHRVYFQQMVVAAGLDLVRRFLLGIEEQPRYFVERKYRPDTDPQ